MKPAGAGSTVPPVGAPLYADLIEVQNAIRRASSTSLETHQISSRRRKLLRVSDDETESNRRLIYGELARRGRDRWASRWCDCQAQLSKRACTAPEHHIDLYPTRCEIRICPWCARRTAAQQVENLIATLDALNKQGAFKRGRATNRPSFKMLTLTLAKTNDLAAGVDRILKAWRKLQILVGFERDKRDRLFGAIAALEIGPHRNVHLHVLYWGRYVAQKTISDHWRALTGDSYVVEIHELRGSWRAAAREVCKYVTKVTATGNWSRSRDADPCLPEMLLVDILEAFSGRRRLATYGLFYNVKVEQEEVASLCERCGASLHYIGTFAPEYLQPWELAAYLSRGDPPGVVAA